MASADNRPSERARPTDDEILQQLGAAVLLCWDELPFEAQGQILAQANDIIGLTPIPGARNEIVGLLSRHARARAQAGIGAIAKAAE